MRPQARSRRLPSFEEMLGDLYGAVEQPERFDTFVAALGVRLKSHLVAIHCDDGTHAHSVRRHFGIGAQSQALPGRDDASINQFLLRGADTLLEEGVLDCARHFRRGELERTAFYADVLAEMDVHHSVGVLVANEGRSFVGLSASRSKRSPGFGQADLRLLYQLRPHLHVVHGLQAREMLWKIPGAGEAHDGTASFCLDADGNLLHASAAGLQMLECSASALRLVDKKLWIGNRSDRKVMTEVLARQLSADAASSVSKWLIHDQSGRTWGFAAARPASVEGIRTDLQLSLPRFVVRVRQAASNVDERAGFLRQMFGLTAAEAELACALLDHGSLSACRTRLDKAYETMRTQLRGLFAKTSTNTQPELIRLLQMVCDL